MHSNSLKHSKYPAIPYSYNISQAKIYCNLVHKNSINPKEDNTKKKSISVSCHNHHETRRASPLFYPTA